MNLDALALKVWAEIGNKDGGVPMVRAALAQVRAEALEEFRLEAQSRESVEASFYRYLRDVAGQVEGDWDGPMICAGLGDQFDYLRGEECDIAIREAMDAHAIRSLKEKP